MLNLADPRDRPREGTRGHMQKYASVLNPADSRDRPREGTRGREKADLALNPIASWPGLVDLGRPQARQQLAMAPARKQTSKRFLSAFASFSD